MTHPLRPVFLLALVALWSPAISRAAVLYSDDFNVDSSGSWTINVAPAANASLQSAQFAFDYSEFGIPAAPGSADTLGLRLRANIPGGAAAPVNSRPAGVQSGLSVSPTGQNFGDNYKMTFYAWSNFFGTANASGLADNVNSQGGTFNVLAAVGTSGTVPLVSGNPGAIASSTIDGIAFVATNDGGIGQDYRALVKSATATTTSPVMAAGTGDNNNAFYQSLFPPVAAPVVQQALALAEYDAPGDTDNINNVMAGVTQAGAFGFAWHKVEITKNAGLVTWKINGTTVASVADADALGLGGANIALGQSDVNSTTARYQSLAFTVFDNLVVERVPEPATGALSIVGLALAGLMSRRKR
jgi:hypothetical protein